MLVKLGSIWVDPKKIIYICSMETTVGISVDEDSYVGAITVGRYETCEEADSVRDSYAMIVNDMLQSQSYGNLGENSAIPVT